MRKMEVGLWRGKKVTCVNEMHTIIQSRSLVAQCHFAYTCTHALLVLNMQCSVKDKPWNGTPLVLPATIIRKLTVTCLLR